MRKINEIKQYNYTSLMQSNPKFLPKSHVNKGIVIPLKCNCPPTCVCGAKQVIDWVHLPCSDKLFINDEGYLFCKNVPNKCTEYFIKDAYFKCNNSNSWQKFQSFSQFAMALAQAIQAAEFELSDQVLVDFVTKLNMKVIQKWNH